MAVRGRAVYNNHNHTPLIYRVIIFFIMVACPGHESTTWVKLKLGTYLMRGSTEDKNHNPRLNNILLVYTSYGCSV